MTSKLKVYREFGRNVRRIRSILGWSQAKTAKLLRISRPSLCNVEQGRQSVLLHDLFRYARVLKVDPNGLLMGVGETKRDAAWREYLEELDGVE